MRETTRTRKTLVGALVAAAASVVVAAPAMATIEYVGGGTWAYGVNYGFNNSEYFHPNNRHRSSVRSNGILYRSYCTDPGLWSVARAAAGLSGNQAYWSNSC